MISDVWLVEKGLSIIINRVNEKEFARYVYMYLKKNPNQVKKVYRLAMIIKEVIEVEFKEELSK